MDETVKQIITIFIFVGTVHFASYVVNNSKPFSNKQLWFNVIGYSIGLIVASLIFK